jgi:hypothetical protein
VRTASGRIYSLRALIFLQLTLQAVDQKAQVQRTERRKYHGTKKEKSS